MPKQVRLRRGTTAQHATFTGADGEVTCDTTKKVLVVHDGVTPGGKPIEGFVKLDPGDAMAEQDIKTRVRISGGDDDSTAFTVDKQAQFTGPVGIDNILFPRRIVVQNETIVYAASINLNFDTFGVKFIALAGNLTLAAINQYNNQQLLVRLLADASTRTLTFPVAWRWIGSAAPANIAANKVALLWLWSFGTADTDIIAHYLVQP